MDFKAVIQRNVKRLRQELGLSRAELAARAKLHPTYIARVENTPMNVTIDNLVKLAKALRRHPAEILGYETVIVNDPNTIAKLDQAADLIRDVREQIEVSE